MKITHLGAAVLALASPAFAAPAEPPLNDSARDIRDIREISLAPDGKSAAATITASTAEGGQTHVWLLTPDKAAMRQLTFSTADTEPGEGSPAWSPDGSALFFRAKRGTALRLYRLPLTGGEAQGLVIARPASGAIEAGWGIKPTDAVEVQQQHYEVSPDGRWIALAAEDSETAARDAQIKKKDDAVHVGQDDRHKTRLYVIETATGKAREVMLPDDAGAFHWDPASHELVVVTWPEDEDLGPASHVWRVAEADLAPKPLPGFPRSTRSVVWTAGGLAYLAQCQDDAPPGCTDLYSYDMAGGASRNLTRGIAGSLVDNLIVDRDGRSIVTPIMTGFRQRLARIDLASGKVAWIDTPYPVVFEVESNATRSGWLMLAGSPTQVKTPFVMPHPGDAPQALATPPLVPADWPRTPSLALSWRNAGLTIEGMLYLPTNAGSTAKVPLVVIVHGGPSGLFQDRNYNLVNLLAAQGWAVLQTNPRGSLGYGAAFLAANKNDLGGRDYADIMAGVDAAIAHYPIDPARLALIGYSYGGEMAGFVEGRTDRFKALVSGAPVIDQFSEYGTEDSSFYDRWYYGKPWEHFADAWRQSPLARVGQAKTPLLLLQGEDDPTDPLGQSQEMRRAMEQVGAPVTLVTYPRETHATLGRSFSAEASREPWHGVDLRRRMINFISAAFGETKPTPGR